MSMRVHVHAGIGTSSRLYNCGEEVTPNLLPLLFSATSLKAQHSSFTRARGARQEELWGRGGEDAHCCPSLLYWDEVM